MYYDMQSDKLYDNEYAMEGLFSKIKEKVKGMGKKKDYTSHLTPISREAYEEEVLPLLKETVKKLSKACVTFYNKPENSRFKKGCSIESDIGENPDETVNLVSYDLWDYVPNARKYEEAVDEPNGRGLYIHSEDLEPLLKQILQNRGLDKYYSLVNGGDWDTWSIYLSSKFKIEG